MATGLERWIGWARDPETVRRVETLARSPLFAGLSHRRLGRLTALTFEKRYAEGETVFAEGDPGKGLFVVLEGSVTISRSGSHGEEALATLGPGEAFGELALIDDLPRSATARVTAPARLLILYRSHFDRLVEGDRGTALQVMRNLLRRLAVYARRRDGAWPPRAGPAAPRESAPL
jgi:CRP-like cAMP-binding protein